MKNVWKWLGGSMALMLVLMGLNCMGFIIQAGTSVFLGGLAYKLPDVVRDLWLENFSLLHFAIMGVTLYIFNLPRLKRNESFFTHWPEDGVSQIIAYIKVVLVLLGLELFAYLLQFVGNAVGVAITSLATKVEVPNTISVTYLIRKIDIFLLVCEAFVASLFISFFARKSRRKQQEERRARKEYERLRNEHEQSTYSRGTCIPTHFTDGERKYRKGAR